MAGKQRRPAESPDGFIGALFNKVREMERQARTKVNPLAVAVATEMGLQCGSALRAKGLSVTAQSQAKAAKIAVNGAIKDGIQKGIEWSNEGNRRTNPFSAALVAALGGLDGITDATRDTYVSCLKWCYQHQVQLQTWSLDEQKKREQKCALTGKPVEIEGTGMGNDRHCIAGFKAMQEKQEGFDQWVAAFTAISGMKDMDAVKEAMWAAMARLGHAEKTPSGEWKAK